MTETPTDNPTTTADDKRDVEIDRAYRHGFMQAWREWSALATPYSEKSAAWLDKRVEQINGR